MPTLVTRGAASVRGFGFAGTTPVLPDPYFNYTTLLLHGNGTNGGQNNTFQDSSTNNFTITRNGNTTQGTFSPFSQTGWSNYFDGSSYLVGPTTNTAFDFGSGNWTIETWVFPTAFSNQMAVFISLDNATSNSYAIGLLINTNGSVQVYQYSGSAYFINSTSTTGVVALNTWSHIAAVRSGSNFAIFVNGTRVASVTTVSGTQAANKTVNIGQDPFANNLRYSGYLSNMRVVKGTAVYDPTQTSITVPTTPLTNITNTSLLTCQSNRFIDNGTANSGSGFTITVNGNTSVQAFSPFAPTAAYSASTVGGSGYFDGTGDYLTVPNSSSFAFGTGDFTIEFWFNTSTVLSDKIFLDFRNAGSSNNLVITTGGSSGPAGALRYASGVLDITSGSVSICNGGWNHCAAVRQSGTVRLYVNGVSVATGSDTSNFSSTSGTIQIGRNSYSGNEIQGHVSDLRIVKGTAVYTAAFTPPTAPLTAITNTSLLLNFTNAGITDNTAKNVLETVADAQISTAQSKFGGGSLYFDGTGDYLSIPNTPLLDIGSGDFTIEFWYYPLNTSSHGIFHNYNSDFQGIAITGNESSAGKIKILAGNGSWFVNLFSSGAATINAWNHIAATRSGSTWTIWINGVSSGTATNSSTASFGTDPATIGRFTSGLPYAMNAYIDDFRITKGIARYTSNFTPQTSQWQDQ